MHSKAESEESESAKRLPRKHVSTSMGKCCEQRVPFILPHEP